MNIFTITSPEQAITIDKLKNGGCEVIQVSNGLLAKTSKSLTDLQKELENATVTELDRNDPNLSKDAKVFAGISE